MKEYMEHQVKSKFEKVVKKVVKVIFIAILAVVFLLLFSYGFMYLWNWLMPDVFGINKVTYWQAVGILVMTKIIFGGFGDHDSGKKKKKSKKCRPRKSSQLKTDFTKWKHYENFWKEEGEQAYNEYVARKNGENLSDEQ